MRSQIAVSLLAGISALAFSSSSWAYCSAPSAPYCATRYGAFDDQDDFDRCKRQMQSYQSEVESFLSCSQREIDDLRQKSKSELDEYNNAVDSFNRRARG